MEQGRTAAHLTLLGLGLVALVRQLLLRDARTGSGALPASARVSDGAVHATLHPIVARRGRGGGARARCGTFVTPHTARMARRARSRPGGRILFPATSGARARLERRSE